MDNVSIRAQCIREGVMITKQDMNNKRQSMKKSSGLTNDLDGMIKILKQNIFSLYFLGAQYKCRIVNNTFKAMFIQTKDMQQTFKAYSSIVCTDATYDIFELGYPFIMLTGIDGNGNTESSLPS